MWPLFCNFLKYCAFLVPGGMGYNRAAVAVVPRAAWLINPVAIVVIEIVIIMTTNDDDAADAEIYRRGRGGSPAIVRPHREDARVRAVSAYPSRRRRRPASLLPAVVDRRRLGLRRCHRRQGAAVICGHCWCGDRQNVDDDDDHRQTVSVVSHRPAIASCRIMNIHHGHWRPGHTCRVSPPVRLRITS